MARGRSTQTITMIKWIRVSRWSIQISLPGSNQARRLRDFSGGRGEYAFLQGQIDKGRKACFLISKDDHFTPTRETKRHVKERAHNHSEGWKLGGGSNQPWRLRDFSAGRIKFVSLQGHIEKVPKRGLSYLGGRSATFAAARLPPSVLWNRKGSKRGGVSCMGTSFIRNRTPLRPYSNPMSRDLWWSYGSG